MWFVGLRHARATHVRALIILGLGAFNSKARNLEPTLLASFHFIPLAALLYVVAGILHVYRVLLN